jgi:hypothetical protein
VKVFASFFKKKRLFLPRPHDEFIEIHARSGNPAAAVLRRRRSSGHSWPL